MSRPAYTLLEVVAASALSGTVLVSALALLSDAVDFSDRIDRQNLLHTFCVSRLEQHLNATAADFQTLDTSDSLASEGFASLRYRVVRSDLPANGGVPSRLMAITCTVWHDANGDTLLSSGEPAVTLAAKLARLALYAAEAEG